MKNEGQTAEVSPLRTTRRTDPAAGTAGLRIRRTYLEDTLNVSGDRKNVFPGYAEPILGAAERPSAAVFPVRRAENRRGRQDAQRKKQLSCP
jgi:hypothetical protein